MARTYQSWGRYPVARPARVERPAWRQDLEAGGPAPRLAYGLGRSYGDVCLNAGGTIVDTSGLDRIISFDREAGTVRAEAGTSLATLLDVIVPAGWFLPVTPGTRWVTLGGAVANDVHGKNHHVAGTFGRHVCRLELLRSDGSRMALGPDDDLFRATVAGIGLTGLITWVEIRLQPIANELIVARHTAYGDLSEFYEASTEAGARSQYVVSWVDSLHPGGRGVLMEGSHSPAGAAAPARPARSIRALVPFDIPGWVLSRPTVRAANAIYGRLQARRGEFLTHYEPYFYPLDAIVDWNRGYGRRGLLQHQSVVPERDAVAALVARVARSGAASFVTVLKTFGDLESPGMMSFPRAGTTLAVDFPHRGERTIRLLRELDDIVREAGGRVYPAKDACMTGANFRAFYPQWESFARHVDPAFSSSFWRRVTADA